MVMTAMNAQEFTLKNMFLTFTSGTPEKPSVMTSEPIFGMQWQLKTDGPNGTTTFNTSLQIGTTTNVVSKAYFESLGTFEHIKAIKVVASIQNSYTLSVKCGKEEFVYSGNEPESDEVQHFFPVKNSVGKVSVTFTFPKFLKKQMYIKSIEVITELKDNENLDNKLRKDQTVSYSVSRTFSKDYWNTICLPFDVSKEALKEAMGEKCALRVFTKEVENNVLKFDNADAIQAGVPYLIKPSAKVENPIFSNVVYKDVKPQRVQDKTGKYAFVGTFDPVNLKVDGSDLFLLANGNLAKPKSEEVREMYGMRAYFNINEQNSSSAKQITYAIDCGSETVNGIQSLHSHPSTRNQHIYNLQGVEVGADIRHLPAGVYVIGGKKIIKR